MWFVLLKDGQPFSGSSGIHYVGTATQDRFLMMVSSSNKQVSLNLNHYMC